MEQIINNTAKQNKNAAGIPEEVARQAVEVQDDTEMNMLDVISVRSYARKKDFCDLYKYLGRQENRDAYIKFVLSELI